MYSGNRNESGTRGIASMSSASVISFTISSKQPCFHCVRPRVEDFAQKAGLGPKVIFYLTLVLDELITNIQSYGYLDLNEHFIKVDIALCPQSDVMTIRVEDDARPFNILEAPEPQLDLPLEERDRPVGGMGILLIKKKMDEIGYERVNGHNVVTLKKKINAEEFAGCDTCGEK